MELERRVSARVSRELEAIRSVPEPVLILNSSCLSTVPELVLWDEHCAESLRELCMKNNRIKSLVRTWMLLIACM